MTIDLNEVVELKIFYPFQFYFFLFGEGLCGRLHRQLSRAG